VADVAASREARLGRTPAADSRRDQGRERSGGGVPVSPASVLVAVLAPPKFDLHLLGPSARAGWLCRCAFSPANRRDYPDDPRDGSAAK